MTSALPCEQRRVAGASRLVLLPNQPVRKRDLPPFRLYDGEAMRSYAQYCPVAKASEILGDRWTLLIVREMLGGASGFNELQRGLPGISRSVLTDRMRALERA